MPKRSLPELEPIFTIEHPDFPGSVLRTYEQFEAAWVKWRGTYRDATKYDQTKTFDEMQALAVRFVRKGVNIARREGDASDLEKLLRPLQNGGTIRERERNLIQAVDLVCEYLVTKGYWVESDTKPAIPSDLPGRR